MLILNKQGFLKRAEATKTAEKIAEINRYIGKEIIKQFRGRATCKEFLQVYLTPTIRI